MRKATRRSQRTRLFGLLAFLLIIGGLAYCFRFSVLFRLVSLENITTWVEAAQSNRLFTVLFYCLFAFGVMILPITIFPIVGGVLFPFGIALILNLAAACAGAWMSFTLARIFGRKAVEPMLKGKLRWLDRVIQSEGFTAIFLLRLVGVPPFIVTNYALGLSAVNTREFLAGTLFGILPWMSLVTYAAHSLWMAIVTGGEKGLMKGMFQAVGPIMVVSMTTLTVLAVRYLSRKRKARMERRLERERREAAEPYSNL